MFIQQPLDKGPRMEEITPDCTLLAGQPALEGNRQEAAQDEEDMRMGEAEIINTLVKMGDALLLRRVEGPNRHLDKGQATPESAYKDLDLKVIPFTNQSELREILQRIGAIPALRVCAGHACLKRDPEIGERASELTGARDIRYGEITDAYDKSIGILLDSLEKERKILRIMLSIRIQRDDV